MDLDFHRFVLDFQTNVVNFDHLAAGWSQQLLPSLQNLQYIRIIGHFYPIHPYATAAHPYATAAHPYATAAHPYATAAHPYATAAHPYATATHPYEVLTRLGIDGTIC